MKQKDIFQKSEGDAWMQRNQQALAQKKAADDPLFREVLEFLPPKADGFKVLEIGCGDGTRLAWLKDAKNIDAYGIDPSAQAVTAANKKGIQAQIGTADHLPFETASFDAVIFGFCLYLCDREDLFRIAGEADRVLRSPGWLSILDFYSPVPQSNTYQHHANVQSYKMDYKTLFTWNPHYTCFTEKVRHHVSGAYTDTANEWISTIVLRKLASPA